MKYGVTQSHYGHTVTRDLPETAEDYVALGGTVEGWNALALRQYLEDERRAIGKNIAYRTDKYSAHMRSPK